MADTDPTYTIVTGKLPALLAKIRETGVPDKTTNAWLESLGFKSSNDRTMLNVLRNIGFIDTSGVPTPAWKQYRGADAKSVLGRAVRSGYQDLYAVYPDAHDRPNSDLANIFSTKTSYGKPTIDKMVSTFKALVGEANFDGGPEAADVSEGSEGVNGNSSGSGNGTHNQGSLAHTQMRNSHGVTVNINVQLALPEGADEQTFEAFFKAMRVHLLTEVTE